MSTAVANDSLAPTTITDISTLLMSDSLEPTNMTERDLKRWRRNQGLYIEEGMMEGLSFASAAPLARRCWADDPETRAFKLRNRKYKVYDDSMEDVSKAIPQLDGEEGLVDGTMMQNDSDVDIDKYQDETVVCEAVPTTVVDPGKPKVVGLGSKK